MGALFFIPPFSQADSKGGTLTEIIRKIEVSHEKIKDLQAEFHQVTHFKDFETVILSNGRFYFKKPGRLRWEYLEPNQNQIVVNKNRIWIFTPELKQVIITPFSGFSNFKIPLRLLVEVSHLERDFEIERIQSEDGNPKIHSGKPLKLRLRPKELEGGLDRVEIEVDAERYLITRIDLFESNGNLSSFTFRQLKTNAGLKDKLFIFTIPKGVEVIEAPFTP